ncbi:MAG: hypothetical protein NTW13_00650, partial [Candidatus Omnitrophica bacterium]|nr:hypothetical protein [Candidatus Omnitrophota bacterium]
ENLNFDLIGILNIDNSLNRVDFRAAEKAFSLLMGLVSLTNKKIIIQTSFPEQHAFEALLKMNPGIFYLKELKTRKQLGFPPYKHLALVKLRAKNLDKVKKAAQDLFEKIKKATPKGVKVISLSPAQPEKLRGNFYWQILLSATDQKKLSVFLKRNLKESRYSGIIVTVDIDPV